MSNDQRQMLRMLKTLVDQVTSGEIECLAVVALHAGNAVGVGWTGHMSVAQMHYGASVLLKRLMDLEGDPDDVEDYA